nr:DEAD/DEAH box helicase [Chloroflexia bacterium]
MDVFEIQRRLVGDYRDYVESFVKIRDPRIRAFVEDEYALGKYWPEASVQLNPAFAPGAWIDDLVDAGALHGGCRDIFRLGDDKANSMRLHRHQEQALHAAQTGASYVLTTGTGSGKSLAYFVPIIDRVLRKGSGRGLRAIVVYPMNALCNSQLEELHKFLGPSSTSPVTYERYTGQESEDKRNEIRANPPDILLTNYVMLELILTRSEDRALLDKAGGLEFFVLDELHTYRGRQGADVAMLTRRVRERTGASGLQCVGTSATMASEGHREDRLRQVASVATLLFGMPVATGHVVDETLSPLFAGDEPDGSVLRTAATNSAEGQLPETFQAFITNPLAAWIEHTFGVQQRNGRMERPTPITISDGAEKLATTIGVPTAIAATAIRSMLMRGYDLRHPETDRPLFAFRLHQFISRGDTVFSTLDRGNARRMTLDGQTVLPGDHDRRLYPLAFCRNCGEDYFVIDMVNQPGGSRLRPREFRDMANQDATDRASGYVWLDSSVNGPDDEQPFAFQLDRIPDQHLTVRAGGVVGPTSQLVKRLAPAEVDASGRITILDEDGPSAAWFVRGRLPFCLYCGEAWEPNVGEFTKLGTLASEGRAGATTIISLKLVQALRASDDLPKEARKLLSFTDNRQDASLQAGHFNDFIVTSLLRAGILAALPTDGATTFDRLPGDIFGCLHLPPEEYASPSLSGRGLRRAGDTLRDVLAYRMFRDLRRGWRVNQPNLEQLALLTVEYGDLDEIAADEAFWKQEVPEAIATLRGARKGDDAQWLQDSDVDSVMSAIASLTAETRAALVTAVLDHFRRDGAIQARILSEHELTALRDRAANNLNDLWGFDVEEPLDAAKPLRVARSQRRGSEKAVDITPLSRTGREIAKPALWDLPQGTPAINTARRLLILHV